MIAAGHMPEKRIEYDYSKNNCLEFMDEHIYKWFTEPENYEME